MKKIDKSVFASSQESHYDGSGNYISDYQKSSATLYVPLGSFEKYASAPVWKNFSNIKEMGSSGITSTIGNSNDNYVVYKIDGTLVSSGKNLEQLKNVL